MSNSANRPDDQMPVDWYGDLRKEKQKRGTVTRAQRRRGWLTLGLVVGVIAVLTTLLARRSVGVLSASQTVTGTYVLNVVPTQFVPPKR